MEVTLQRDEKDMNVYHLRYRIPNGLYVHVCAFFSDYLVDLADGKDTSWFEHLAAGQEVPITFRLEAS